MINLMRKCQEKDISYQIYSGVSFVDISMTALKEDPVNGLKIIDAFEMNEQIPDKTMGNLVTQVFNRHMASEVAFSARLLSRRLSRCFTYKCRYSRTGAH